MDCDKPAMAMNEDSISFFILAFPSAADTLSIPAATHYSLCDGSFSGLGR
jgi:hypothetical protein